MGSGIAFCAFDFAYPLKPLRHLLLLIFALALAGRLATAEETGGIVRSVTGETVTVETAGPTPQVGDAVEFFFQVPDVNDPISVATGRVTAVESAGSVKVKIENATGEVAKDHLARFKGGGPTAARPADSPSLPAVTQSPAGKPSGGADEAALPYLNKGVAQFSTGDMNGAIESFTRAIELSRANPVFYYNRANAYYYKPDFNAALTDVSKALELKITQRAEAFTLRAAIRARLGDYDEAIADCNAALEINPKYALAYNNRANDKLQKRDYEGALTDANKALSLDPNLALGYYTRGLIHASIARFSEAVSDWTKAVQLQPNFGAELNPKIAQLKAAGLAKKQPAKNSARRGANAGWTDLTNAPRKLVGSWKGGRHVTQYLADGSFYTDPHLVPNPPRGQWRIEGDRLIEFFPLANETVTHRILSITDSELVIQNAKGQTFRLKRGTE